MKLLNVGCGTRYHTDWINIDFYSNNKNIVKHDLRNGIPYKSDAFDVVYHSHVIEHFSKDEAIDFIHECYRVLTPGGIMRIATPNLEKIVSNYLTYFKHALTKNKLSELKYDWTMIEMYDQCVRNVSGGEMGKIYSQNNSPISNFIYKRTGIKLIRKNCIHTENNVVRNNKKSLPLIEQIRRYFRYYQLGKFRFSGEIHQWMYDRFSLARLLRQAGFKNIRISSAKDSRIPKWNSYYLDTNQDGTIYKPDSLYMEAIK